mmetsp:Transcript_3867/g.8516  ORF Transcript_3867/g.8516 Transcript_3867/m.8516 type:complete len:213 (-) Transcript_3867:87-725(-)|eukprot:CAMPEP_0185851382 /NCGR_PEP_ID=MMETSP1354-20130828/9240_1 /TAXON_ID=708628 /ORGANISM="Erythrolobus madagascarensis, Strain CCMP3276" /LENGTH=212 /DNA_ID=CAMNT_0028552359 /DNA_START=9 /DNA_END=647 /DNA_ORIENTATION=-
MRAFSELMRAVALVLVLAASWCGAEEVSGEGGGTANGKVVGEIPDLTDVEFSAISSGSQETWLVMVHAPWCGHCKRFMPQLHELSEKLSEIGVSTGKLDGSQYRAVSGKYGLEGFPSFLLLRSSEGDEAKSVFRFKGARSVENLYSFAVHQKFSVPADASGADMIIPIGSKSSERLLLIAAFSFPVLIAIMLIVSCVSFLKSRSMFEQPKTE